MTATDQLVEWTRERRQAWQMALDNADLDPSQFTALASPLTTVFEGSEYLAQAVTRYPEILPNLFSSGRLESRYEPGEVDRLVTEYLGGVADEDALSRRLRAFRREQMVRIIWRDLAGLATLAETLEDLSALADACIDHALRRLYEWATEKSGIPRDQSGVAGHLVVLGMGKLGARELNLSSDIDLIFAYPADGEVDGPRPSDNQRFFVKLAQRLIAVLDTQTADGFVFRVDARLRPFGEVGPLALSFGAMEAYYQSQAREWERYAMIKARVVADPGHHGEELMGVLRPFVYRRYLDFGAFESLREMKALINRELERKGMADNIKLGPGGIREIEFIGQAFQLIRGGRDPDLQVRPIQTVLRLLAEKGLLPEFVSRELDSAYVFLRRLENRLQAWQDRQTHTLPPDSNTRHRIARAMGLANWEALMAELDAHRQRVHGHFERVFVTPHTEEDETDERPLERVWTAKIGDEEAVDLLERAGFVDAPQTLARLDAFRTGTTKKGLSSRGRERLGQLMPLLLEATAGTEQPDLALERVLPLIESVVRRTAYLALLIEHPIAVSQLVRLSCMSPWIAEQLGRQPLLLDELLDARRLYAPLGRGDLEDELRYLLAGTAREDLEEQMERLRQFAHGNVLRVAAADLTEAIPLTVVSDYLTEIAEVAVAQVLRLAFEYLAERHGRPPGMDADETGLIVVGYGKLGGIELGYGSDLDLVFLYAEDAIGTTTDGDRPISAEQFYARLGQRIIHMMSTHTHSGILYEVDMRLRPDGNKGLLARSLASFAEYQVNQAWTWEHQALVRARSVAGDSRLAERFGGIRREILQRTREPDQLRADVIQMRDKMRDKLDHSSADYFDLKQGRGGIADIEFIVQYAVLRWACEYPNLADWTDNIRLLDTLGQNALLPEHAAVQLSDAYKRLRAAYHRSALQERPTRIPTDQLVDVRSRVCAIWDRLLGEI